MDVAYLYLALTCLTAYLCRFRPIHYTFLFTFLYTSAQFLDVAQSYTGLHWALLDLPVLVACLYFWRPMRLSGAGLLVGIVVARMVLHGLRDEGLGSAVWVAAGNSLYVVMLAVWWSHWKTSHSLSR